MDNCVFCKIEKGDISADFIYQDNEVMVFSDLKPLKPVHLLIVPKKHIEDILFVDNDALKAKLLTIVQTMVKEKGLDTKGFRVTINGGGAQEIQHLHIHLYGPMGSAAKM